MQFIHIHLVPTALHLDLLNAISITFLLLLCCLVLLSLTLLIIIIMNSKDGLAVFACCV